MGIKGKIVPEPMKEAGGNVIFRYKFILGYALVFKGLPESVVGNHNTAFWLKLCGIVGIITMSRYRQYIILGRLRWMAFPYNIIRLLPIEVSL